MNEQSQAEGSVAPAIIDLTAEGAGVDGGEAELADFGTRAGLDHVHIHSFADAAHVGSISRAMGGPPYSLHLHGDLPVYGTDHLLKARGASFAAAAARPMQRQLVEAGIPEERTVTMWMGVDTTRFTPAEAPPPPGPLRLISVSRLALCKGHRYALRALRLALDAGLDATYEIIGRGPDAEEIRAEMVRLGLEAKVKMVGALGEDQILERLRASDACVLSSVGLGEASPVAVMEAMSCGLAPVVSVIGGTPDMIRHGETGLLVAQEDVPGLCAAFQRLRDSAERARLGAAARASAVADFDSRVLARKLLDRIELAHRTAKG